MRMRPAIPFANGMKNSKIEAVPRRRPKPRRFWSGVAPIGTLSDEGGKVAAAVALLPRTRSAPEDIVQSLLDLGSRYHRYLHQDAHHRRAALGLGARERPRTVGAERFENGRPIHFPRKNRKSDEAIATAASTA